MDFNIQKFIKNIQVNNKEFQDSQKILTLLQEYIPSIHLKDIKIQKGILSFKHISPLQRSHIKRYKREILEKAKNKEVFIRDII